MEYCQGFRHHIQTEAKAGALPLEQNAPQSNPYNLYTEQLSGTAFTAPRAQNLRSWLYRLLPSVVHGEFSLVSTQCKPKFANPLPPNQLRWQAISMPNEPCDFIDGLIMMASNGDYHTQSGGGVYYYRLNQSMTRYFYDADGELLLVPQLGQLEIRTEMGRLSLEPNEIAVIPRGVKFQVLSDGPARGYVCENYGAAFQLPELGPIGANGLANPRHFETPVAWYEQINEDCTLVCKFQGEFWQATLPSSPLNVVAWQGNYAPYKYNLKRFNTINTVSFDHPDPSIFTVLTSPTERAGTANLDFVIFPERWMVAEHTFRPPYYHRNIMSEIMGLVHGSYDAKNDAFTPGGMSIHNCMTAHGPDADTFHKASKAELAPARYKNTLAFMFESQKAWQVTEAALALPERDLNYNSCWTNLKPACLNETP